MKLAVFGGLILSQVTVPALAAQDKYTLKVPGGFSPIMGGCNND